jgi:hypothetical protein
VVRFYNKRCTAEQLIKEGKQRIVDLRLGEGSVSAEKHLFAPLLLARELGQQQFRPTFGAVDVAGTELGGETVTLAIESSSG